MTANVRRCVNLDWLEVDALEPANGQDAEYFRSHGLVVDEREYGTRVFGQMFTIYGGDHLPFIEIRRQPKTSILSEQDVHLRLCNRTCYFDNAAQLLADFMYQWNYTFMRIVRVDICLDFEHFDKGDDPKAFLLRYLSGKFSKINQANIHSHGKDEWSGRNWNSISWGSPTSDIGTKMYDKTLELYDETTNRYKKPYIRQAWQVCGLVDNWEDCTKHDATGNQYKPTIWRVEFSIRSSVKNWFKILRDGKNKNKQSIRNTLEMYDSRDKLLMLFASLAQHYFHFKYYEPEQRKDRCKDKVLFQWSEMEYTYKVEKVAADSKPNKPLMTLLSKIRVYRECHYDDKVREACNLLIKYISDEEARIEAGTHFTTDEIIALRTAISLKAQGDNTDVTILLRNIKALLKINDKTAPFLDNEQAVQ